MTLGPSSPAEPASRPPSGLPGLDPRWSRLLAVPGADGVSRTFHVLDSWVNADGSASADEPAGTLLCVHGNPTWSYLWRRMLAAAPPGWRVVAPDHLGMGFSERIERPRGLAERVEDLSRLTAALKITGPVVTLAHDWGGIISLGWALEHRAQLRGVVLTNTAVHQPETVRGPLLIRLAHLPPLNLVACRLTPLFVWATTAMTRPRLPRPVRNAFSLPYRTVGRRRAVGEFVADIPFRQDAPSRGAMDSIAAGVSALEVPALLLWGPRDPVFSDVYLRDLQERLPHAALHRYELAGHLLPEDAPGYAAAVAAWIGRLPAGPVAGVQVPAGPAGSAPPTERPSVLRRLEIRAHDDSPAVVEVGGAGVSWRQLAARVRTLAADLSAAGVRPGHRVALLIPPSIDLTVALYGVWCAGGVIVVADKGLGLRGMGRALRGARIDHLIADTAGLLAAGPMRLPGTRLALKEQGALVRRLGRLDATVGREVLGTSGGDGRGVELRGPAEADDAAAVLFTSGATGPAKGVLYRHRQVRAQLQLIADAYGLTADDRIVAAFAPFALYGPALGLASVVPRTDVTTPGRLTAAALADAAVAVDATVVFASPAALRNVVRTAVALTGPQRAALARVRLMMSAGASVPAVLLREIARVLPNADLHTPYGMTEALPLTDISLAQIEEAGTGDGVCVGLPLPGVVVEVAPLDLTGEPGVSGEIWARGEHIRDRYDAAWVVDQAASAHPGWHRTGDVGFLDARGRLWVQGRLVHTITTADGPVTPVGVELRVEAGLAADRSTAGRYRWAAAVGIGPAAIQQVVVVLEGLGGPLAPPAVAAVVRRCAGVPVAAVLVRKALPVDIRHNSKIDRIAVARWAADVLAGG